MEKIGAFADADRVTAEGEWQPGNPATGQKATPMLSAWFNMLQRELVALVEAAGLTLDVDNEAQLLAALQTLGLGGYADAAEAQALSSLTKILTPGTLDNAFMGSNQSLALSGFQILPGGLIMQWGSFTASYNNSSVTEVNGIGYPIVFPSRGFFVLPIISGGVGSGAGFTQAVTSVNSDSFDYRCTTTGSGYSSVTVRFLSLGE